VQDVAQVATYLRLFGSKQGLIMNFNAPRLKDGLKSVIARDAVVEPISGDNIKQETS